MKPQLPAYYRLSAQKRRMVELRERGYTHVQIAKTIQVEFDNITITKGAVSDLFREGTPCHEALNELREYLADQAVQEAQQLVRSTYKDAVATLIELTKKPAPPHVRVNAAKSLAQNILSIKELAQTNDSGNSANNLNEEITAIIKSALPHPDRGAEI